MSTEQLAIKEPNGKPLIELKERPLSAMALLQIALENKAAIDVIERLAALQERSVASDALMQFNEAMESAQNEISEVIPDMENPETKKKYASFKALNRAVRPVYLRHGFTLSFNAAQSDKPEEILVLCDCSHKGGHAKQYLLPMPTDGKGAKGGGVMSKSHATLAATSYGRSCLLRLIFNLAIDDDKAGSEMDQDELKERLAHFAKCQTMAEVFDHFKMSYMAAEEAGDVKAQIALSEAKDNRKKEIQNARAKS